MIEKVNKYGGNALRFTYGYSKNTSEVVPFVGKPAPKIYTYKGKPDAPRKDFKRMFSGFYEMGLSEESVNFMVGLGFTDRFLIRLNDAGSVAEVPSFPSRSASLAFPIKFGDQYFGLQFVPFDGSVWKYALKSSPGVGFIYLGPEDSKDVVITYDLADALAVSLVLPNHRVIALLYDDKNMNKLRSLVGKNAIVCMSNDKEGWDRIQTATKFRKGDFRFVTWLDIEGRSAFDLVKSKCYLDLIDLLVDTYNEVDDTLKSYVLKRIANLQQSNVISVKFG